MICHARRVGEPRQSPVWSHSGALLEVAKGFRSSKPHDLPAIASTRPTKLDESDGCYARLGSSALSLEALIGMRVYSFGLSAQRKGCSCLILFQHDKSCF